MNLTTPKLQDKSVSFTVPQLVQVLQRLGEAPAKFTLDVINFIQQVADSQLTTSEEDVPEDVAPETVV